MKRNINRLKQIVTALLRGGALCIALSHAALATQTGDSKVFVFTGVMTLLTPCVVNGDQPVTVTFGNVGISKIDTGKYLQDLNYSLNCGGATSANKVNLYIIATPAAWDTKAIATDVDGLGAEILRDGNPLELNTAISVSDPANPPALQVLLVKQKEATLTDRPFTATGTLIVNYI